MSRYRFVEAESSRYPVTQLCRIAQVSRAAYYQWQEGTVSPRQMADAALTAAIRAIHAASAASTACPACWPSCVRRATTWAASASRG